jgi:hypothetical protein
MPRERDPEVTLFGDRGLLAALVAPLFATLSALLGVLGGDSPLMLLRVGQG